MLENMTLAQQKADRTQEYVDLYQDKYDDIKGDRPRWLTISPPSNDDDPAADTRQWIKKHFYQFHYFMKDCICIVEFKHLRLHFHIFYSLKDKKKEYIVLNGIRKISQIKVYDGEPAKGISYLFKDIEEAEELLGDTSAVYSINDIKSSSKKTRSKAKKRIISHAIECRYLDEPEIPKWFRA